MPKDPPNLGRVAVMVGFALSCIGLAMFLWLSFGGPLPLKPKGYRVSVTFPEAATLAQEADVRISGINVGKVKKLEPQKQPPAEIVTLEIDADFAPIPKDTRAMLRQKTLLGETYVELTPGSRDVPKVADGGELASGQVASTVELDEIFRTFDEPTREAFRQWVAELAKSTKEGGGRDLNEAFASLPGFTTAAADLVEVLDRRRDALERLVRNTGVVFQAINERDGALRDLIVNSNNLFETTASRDEALAETIRIFPTFLDESRATVARLEDFSVNTRPLVQDLTPVARDLGPTVRDLGDLAPDLEDLFGDVDSLNHTAPSTLPDATRFLDGAEPVLETLHPFLQELNPILSFANFDAPQLADFITVGGAALAYKRPPLTEGGNYRHFLRQIGMINGRGVALNRTRPSYERANAYLEPNAHLRMRAFGVLESFDCSHVGGEKPQPEEGGFPPCFVKPGSLFDGGRYPTVGKDEAPLRPPPAGNEGTEPAQP
jgi:virulence factor Mce-like protein